MIIKIISIYLIVINLILYIGAYDSSKKEKISTMPMNILYFIPTLMLLIYNIIKT